MNGACKGHPQPDLRPPKSAAKREGGLLRETAFEASRLAPGDLGPGNDAAPYSERTFASHLGACFLAQATETSPQSMPGSVPGFPTVPR